MRSFSRLLMALLLGWTGLVQAAEPDQQALQEQLQKIDSRIAIESLKATPLDNIYEVQLSSGDLLYISADGQYLLAGSLLRLGEQGVTDLTEQTRSQIRRQQLQDIPVEDQVVFAAEGDTQAVIQVFTDITCPYCIRLHGEVPELNAAGVEVRYLAFPRQGVDSEAYQKLVNVWCADDRQKAMNRAKGGEDLASAECDNPVAEQFEMGRSQGVQGTPAIVLPDGKIIPGYVPAERLLKQLGL
ncbi:DsbC family protein [Marinospirillum sp.]|uniref:DsbC family protein n=1 Tax=Marinospirillum sp. TaxID=2183934 RepID=UPI00286FD37E|nr:DsbC family protein [Marinospirillum sp.]MDR9467552.1 DsbC family protein [Marinospirillum sp.]